MIFTSGLEKTQARYFSLADNHAPVLPGINHKTAKCDILYGEVRKLDLVCKSHMHFTLMFCLFRVA
jgi:hypothetical protein